MSQLLNHTSIASLNDAVIKPSFAFQGRKASIVHMGIGAFHKAHQATFTHSMMEKVDGDYKIIAVSLRSSGARDLLKSNDNLYTSVERASGQTSAKIIAAIETVLVAPEDPAAVLAVLSNPQIKTITSTVTEKGYCLLPGNSGLNLKHPDIIHDLANPDNPKTFIGYMVKACLTRMNNQINGFDYISCDNLPDNSHVAGTAMLQYAKQLSAELVDWIKQNVSFCNSMVDRIVPAVTKADSQALSDEFGYQDKALVVSEPYRQWVIEDKFKHGRPPWDVAGAQFVDDVAKYEKLKLRFLNGSHSALAYLGKVAGIEFIHQAISNPNLKALVINLMDDMATTLDTDLDVDVSDYGKTIIQRFSNHSIQYGTQQVATDGSQKLPQRIFAPLTECVNAGQTSNAMCAVIAAWFMYLQGKDELGNTYQVNDPLSEKLVSIVSCIELTYEQRLEKLMSINGLFPTELVESEIVKDTILSFLKGFIELGVLNTLAKRFDN